MAPSGYLLMTNVPAQKWCASIFERSQLIGRANEADIKVDAEHSSVSRRHAEIGCHQGSFWIQDLGSTAGTRVNGVQIQPKQKFRLAAGDRLWIGGLELDVVGLPSASPNVEARPHKEGDTVELRRQKQTASVADTCEPSEWQRMLKELTPTELDVVLWMARGYTSPEDIGARVQRSRNTIRTHFNSIFHKLKIHSRDELLAMIRRSEAELAVLPE